VRLRVAERLLSHALAGNVTLSKSGRIINPAATSETGSAATATNGAPTLVDKAVANADAPIALVEVNGADSTFAITYANAAMGTLIPGETDPVGKSLAQIEAWTPEFLTMILSFVQRGALVSYVPLWSKIRLPAPVHLSFYPVTGDDGMVRSYLVIHQL